jgi:hypothetical protein
MSTLAVPQTLHFSFREKKLQKIVCVLQKIIVSLPIFGSKLLEEIKLFAEKNFLGTNSILKSIFCVP